MKVTLFMAQSLNGIIARESNEEDFLSHENWISFINSGRKFGNFVWGRRTQEVVKTWGKQYQEDIRNIRKVVVSRNYNLPAEEGYSVVASPKEAVELLQKEGFENVLLVGGSTINSAFAKEELLDELIINIEPVVVGQGIPIFAENDFDFRLKLEGFEELSESIIQLKYSVLKN